MNTFAPDKSPSSVLSRPPSSGTAAGTQKPTTPASPYGTLGVARATSPAFEAGQQVRQSVNSAVDMAKKVGGAVVNTVTLPTRVGMAVAGDAASGFLGRPLSAPAQPAAPVARPQPAAAVPAARPVEPSAPAVGTALPVGPNAGGRADPPAAAAAAGQAFTNSRGKPAIAPPGIAVSQDAAGRPVFTASGESVAQAGAAPVAPVVDSPSVPTIARPQYVDPAPGAIIGNPDASDEAQRRLEIALSGATFRPARSRGARDAQAAVVQGLFGHAGRVAEIASANERAQLAGKTQTNLARMDQQGQDFRDVLEQSGENHRAALADSGETLRNREAQDAATERTRLARPTEYVTDADGNYLALGGTVATPLTVDGKPLRAPRGKDHGSITPVVALDALTKQLEAEQGSLQPNRSRLEALQQQINRLIAGQNYEDTGAPAHQFATNPMTGERVRLNPESGEWELIDGSSTNALPQLLRPGAPQR